MESRIYTDRQVHQQMFRLFTGIEEIAGLQLPLKFLVQGWSDLLSAADSFGAWIATKISTIYSFEIDNLLP
jgi:hypothetical protein